MRYQPKYFAMFCKGLGKKLDMSSGAAGNTSTGDRTVASSQTSQEAVAVGGRISALSCGVEPRIIDLPF